jgi:hypothetical protein
MNIIFKTLINNKYRFILGIVFALSYSQDPLYTSNQNTYLLHGLANSNMGFLSSDWMANTVDPFPLFSSLISLTYSNTSPFFFYIYYAIILGVFIFSIMGITSELWNKNRSHTESLTNFVFITGICSVAFSYIALNLTGNALSSIVLNGVADQYILGSIFQPSTFGVFLLLSIYVFLKGKPFFSVIFLGVAASFHPTYLLGAATLTLSYMKWSSNIGHVFVSFPISSFRLIRC